ncbi:zinc finger BED domain-containing protein RICESLEEPER 2-like [Neltuma alba]|uniref:zinc finger BED domain-containing protein RICESLEEPER 2-like n=1 Tax=Neltuma alba TaxID=207710 RepID=UPI0010A3A056|nr:zinc finger BED domain-containing protein RICESLEEPER 2-like [Prosopis alba]
MTNVVVDGDKRSEANSSVHDNGIGKKAKKNVHLKCGVQEGLKVASSAIQKIRNSIRYVKASEARAINFKKCIEQVGVRCSMGLRLDVPTRWNSTHSMLESALYYHRAFATLAFNDTNYHHSLTIDEWSRAEMICEFFAPFARITELISGTSYPTSNLYFVQISKIKLLLKEFLDHDDVVIQNMVASMLEKFDKYWSDYSVILAIAIILDPRMKFDIIRFSYAQLDPVNHTEKIEHIRKKMYLVFNEYKIMDVVGSSSSTPSPIVAPNNDSGSSNASDMNIMLPRTSNQPPSYPSKGGIISHGCLNTMAFGDYLKCKSKDIASMENSKLDFYLEEATMDPNLFLKMDVLDYLRTNAACFPYLSKMACDILSILITTVASESAFSIGS